MNKIMIAAGGTGGHIFPGLAIAEQLKKIRPESEIIFIGSHYGMEKNIIPKFGYKMEFVRAKGFGKALSFKTISAAKSIFDSIYDSKRILKKYKPELVIGMGGFTCAMFVRTAAKMGIPTMIHEQNAFPGKTNRMLGSYVDRIAISFERAADYFPADKCFYSGNPIREAFKTVDRKIMRQQLNIGEDERMILAVGGSQGAESINHAMLYLMAHSPENTVICHVTGKKNVDAIKQSMKEKGITEDHFHRIIAFTNEMEKYLGACDLAVCRAGASTIAELAAVGVPAILIPYPYATNDHQTYNAKEIEVLGGGIIIPDDELTGEKLFDTVLDLLDDDLTLNKMGESIRKYGDINADKLLAENAVAII